MHAVCLSFLILSGMAALVYQVTWVRLLGLSMGSSSASVATVLAAFFLGMSLGSVMARHLVRPRLPALTPYAALEALIGVAGLALLPALLHLDALVAALPVLGDRLGARFAVAMTLLAVPSVCIGATFPVMAHVLIRHRDEIGLRLGQLYSVNTLGAVLGAALSGFVLIPALGLDGAVYVAAGANFAIVLGAVGLMRFTPLGRPEGERPDGEHPAGPVPAADAGPPPPHAGWALSVLFLTGFASIAVEVGYTKYLAIFVGTTIYGFSAILATFLVGITLGSWLIRRRIDRIGQPLAWVAWGLVLLGAGLALTRSGLTVLPALDGLLSNPALPAWALDLARYGAVFALLVVPTTLFGALFPLNLRLYCGDVAGVSARTGRGYAVNTVGGILGSLVAGFVVIPRLGTDVLLLGTAALMVLAALPLLAGMPGAARRGLAWAAVLGALGALLVLPRLDFHPMIAARIGPEVHRTYTYLKEGKTSVVTLTTTGGPLTELSNNGLKEIAIFTANPNHGGALSVLLGAVPYLVHEAPESAFVVGFGGGITTYTLTTTDLAKIRVVELEPVIVDAVRSLHGGTIPALQDPRVRLDIDDARHRLLIEPDSYDLILSQPSHPWVAGAANVFTREYYRLIASRLNPGGLATQWVNLFHMDATTLGSILNAFFDVFPEGAVFGLLGEDVGALLLVGSDTPLSFDTGRMARRLELPSLARGQIPDLVPTPNDLFKYYLLSRDEALALAPGAPRNTDTNILCEVRLARLRQTPVGAENPFEAVAAHAGYDIAPFLDAPRAPALYRFATNFLAQGQFTMAARAEARLAAIDPVRGRWLRHERLVESYYYPEATALYARHDDWPDAARYGQAVVFMEVGRLAEARAAVAGIGDAGLRRLGEIRLLFAAKRWDELAAFPSRTPAERAWQLVGVFRTAPGAAAAELVELDRRHFDLLGLPQLRLLARYQRDHPGFAAGRFDAYGRLLKASYAEGNRLATLAREAKRDGQLARARFLLARFEQVIDPGSGFGRRVRREILAGKG